MKSAEHPQYIERRRRRRWLPIAPLLLLAGLGVALAAGPSKGASSGTGTPTSSQPVTVSWGKTATCTNLSDGATWDVTVFEPFELADVDHVDHSPGTKLIGVGIAARARGVKTVDVGAATFKLRCADGALYYNSLRTGQQEPLQHGTIEPGQTVRELIVIEVPEEAVIIGVQCDTGYGYADPAAMWTY